MRKILSLMFCLLFSFGLLNASELNGKVVKVSDGDTITLLSNKTQYRVRLFGIDAPESGQAYAKKSKEFLSSMIAGKEVRVEYDSKDRYGRYLGTIYHNGVDINARMVESGYAWSYSYYSKKYDALQNSAKKKRLGLWQDKNPINPYEFRKSKKKGF